MPHSHFGLWRRSGLWTVAAAVFQKCRFEMKFAIFSLILDKKIYNCTQRVFLRLTFCCCWIINKSKYISIVVVLVIRYAIRSAKSGHPAVGKSLDRLVQRWLGVDISVVATTFLSWGSSRIIQKKSLQRDKLLFFQVKICTLTIFQNNEPGFSWNF